MQNHEATEAQELDPTAEIILNLWYVADEDGLIYSLRVRAYVGTGSEEEKLALLRRFALLDYLITQPFPIPERFHIWIEGKKMPVSHVAPFQTGVTPWIHLFEEAIQAVESSLPAQTHLTIGQDPLICITPLVGDEEGNIQPRFGGTRRL